MVYIKSYTCLVPTDEDGIIPAALEEAIVRQNTKHGTRPLTEKKPYRGLIYLIPTFDNPTGRCLSEGLYLNGLTVGHVNCICNCIFTVFK